ncbi:glycoside hydrolase family 75 protein [Lentithecium fluviatile CBS 122367]|uniref:Endo-chitosanase n=1 Tax=Lentithecium fluviatile CBS 122367 TaxID=1168545 RepID=A0A6G1J964_9PLEO|nr:glycoside hydrolase family 75 protein [Lentithecium fluviatile CBS 122367]
MRSSTSLALALATAAAAREIPASLKAFYDANLQGDCPNPISSPYSDGHGSSSTVYCQDPTSGAIFLKSSSAYTDVDIDCDGAGAGTGDCGNDQSGQSITAWADIAAELSGGAIEDLNTHHHTFVVFGNDSPKFDPTEHGIEPLSVMAVVCGDKYILGVMGDSNGADLVGEASISLAKLCFPDEDITGNSGHTEKDVLFLAFPGKDAVPTDAKWGLEDASVFEESLWATGDALLETLGTQSSSGSGRNGTATTTKHVKSTPAPTKTKSAAVETETAAEEGDEDEDEGEWEKRWDWPTGAPTTKVMSPKKPKATEAAAEWVEDEVEDAWEKRGLGASRVFRGMKM